MFIRLQRYEARAARAPFHRSPLLQPQQIYIYRRASCAKPNKTSSIQNDGKRVGVCVGDQYSLLCYSYCTYYWFGQHQPGGVTFISKEIARKW